MKIRFVAILAASVLAVGLGWAQDDHRRGHDRDYPGFPPAHIEHMTAMLGLSDDQVVEVKGSLEGNREAALAQRDALRAARQELDDAIHAAEFDEAAVREAARTLGDLEADAAVAKAQMFQEMRRILTPEQLDTLDRMIKTRAPHGDGNRKGHGHH